MGLLLTPELLLRSPSLKAALIYSSRFNPLQHPFARSILMAYRAKEAAERCHNNVCRGFHLMRYHLSYAEQQDRLRPRYKYFFSCFTRSLPRPRCRQAELWHNPLTSS